MVKVVVIKVIFVHLYKYSATFAYDLRFTTACVVNPVQIDRSCFACSVKNCVNIDLFGMRFSSCFDSFIVVHGFIP